MFHLIVLIALLLFTPAAQASSEAELAKQIDGLFYAYTQALRPGYAIGVIERGELVFARGYGYADLERKRKITPDTAFNLASLSKQLTAAMVALSIERGEMHLKDNLARHWPDLPSFMADIQIDHLVYMSSGLPEYYTLPSPKGGWSSEDKFTVTDAINAVFAANRLEYRPGSRWTYSNINYQLLAEVVAKRQATTFAELSHKWLFQPLAMTNTWVDAPVDTQRPYRASAYQGNRVFGWRLAHRKSPHYGGSGVFSSLNDLAKWDKALYYSKVLGAGFRQRMLSTRTFQHDKTNDAFGLVHGEYQGRKTIWYAGGDDGVSTYMAHLPESNQTVICLANFADGDCQAKARAVMDLLFL